MAVVGRGYNELERRRVFNKTLLDAGVESSRELSEGFGVVQSSQWNKEKTEMRTW